MKLAEIINIIQGLIDEINARTGKNDATLSEAVDRVTSENMVDTSDGTAVSGDLKNGKTAFVNGKKITGTLPRATQITNKNYADDNGVSVGTAKGTDGIRRLNLSYDTKSERYFETGTYVSTVVGFENFGDALEDDVASGKTFTSAAGLKKIGTAEMFKKKTGTIEIAGDTGSFVIDTGLSKVDTILVKKGNPGDKETYFWAGKSEITCICATGVNYINTVSQIDIAGGKVTCKRYNAQYPIKAGTFKWVAYGS